MVTHELKTQIFYLDRIFKILSDGYNPSYIILNPMSLPGDVPNSKKEVASKDLENLLDILFSQLYEHNKQCTDAPKVFSQDWNNEFLLKTIQETKINILHFVKENDFDLKTYHSLGQDDYQVIEFYADHKTLMHILLFLTEWH